MISTPKRMRFTRGVAVAVAVSVALVACGGESSESSTAASSGSELIGADRCQQNRDAGSITYLTSYDMGGTAGILSAVTADGMGFYDDLCLDVQVKPKADNNAQLVSAGRAQFAGMGSAGDVLAAQANGAKVTGIGTFGNVGQVALLTMADGPIKSLGDLKGKTVGYKGTLPTQLRSMLDAEGVDTGAIDMVSVGFDPRILPQGTVDAVQGFQDNEPITLEEEGENVRLWKPADYGVQGTFGVTIVNTEWAEKNPTAGEDFLRATYHAFDWISESDTNLEQALEHARSVSQAGFEKDHEKRRWEVSRQLVVDNQIPGRGVGYQSAALWEPEANDLVRYGLIKQAVDIDNVQTSKYVDAIYDGPSLIWPAPGAGE